MVAGSRSRGCRKTHIRKSVKIFPNTSPVDSDDSSCSDSQLKNWNPRGGDKGNKSEAKKEKSKGREGIRHSLGGDEVLYRKELLPTIVETQFASERRECREPHKTPSESEGKPEAANKNQESQFEGNGSEVEGKIKGKKKRHVPRKAVSSFSDEQSDDSISDDCSGSTAEEESGEGQQGNSSEQRSSKEGSDCEESKLGSEDDENELSSLAEIKSNHKKRPFPSGVRLKTGSSKIHQESHQTEEDAADKDTQMTEELEGGGVSSSNSPCNEANFLPQRSSAQPSEDEKNVPDAKFATVFPRGHQLVKLKNASLGTSGNSKSLKQLCDQSSKAAKPVRPSVEGEVSQDPVHSNMEKEDAGGMTDFIQRTASEAVGQVHWTQQKPLRCDPVAWLNSETLLPRLTIENLSKWTLYTEQNLAKRPRSTASRERWETEDVAEDTLEMDLAQKQKYKNEDCYLELETVEDLSGLEHIFAVTEMAYTFSQSSEREQCILLSGHSGSGKTEAAKAIILYLSRLCQPQEICGKKQSSDVLPILESFGNAKTLLNDNSSRFGKFLHIHLRHGFTVGMSVSPYLLEKSRVVFQGCGERSFHVFYELLAGLPIGQKEELYLQEAETYFYLNQASE
ncbi:UNVERIFIED_CONTAM: hypothetical protein K2H54_014901 [Gekko kuhli]